MKTLFPLEFHLCQPPLLLAIITDTKYRSICCNQTCASHPASCLTYIWPAYDSLHIAKRQCVSDQTCPAQPHQLGGETIDLHCLYLPRQQGLPILAYKIVLEFLPPFPVLRSMMHLRPVTAFRLHCSDFWKAECKGSNIPTILS